MTKLVIGALLTSILLVLAGPSGHTATTYTGKVISIADGDTLRILYRDGQLKIRLAEIDTPERKQPWGNRARQALSDKVFGKIVDVVEIDRDRYGRIVGRIYLDGRDINREMVAEGHAWVYRKYMRDESLLTDEAVAREAGRGLWSLPEAKRVPPWEWRRR
jgi:endonuclease YncB( thermonuclease family)